MKLESVSIKNFRSIENLLIECTIGCQVLIGINESGKSNILRAMQLLDPSAAVTPSDLRLERADEGAVQAGYVRFAFALDGAEQAKVFEAAKASVASAFVDRPMMTRLR